LPLLGTISDTKFITGAIPIVVCNWFVFAELCIV